ncbi:oligosaccharide flippase family protein [Bacteroidales bacterium OttesenSCG-928-M11]|nr:oligosaccharide flippase family protein [Bacteroidales bacterium OttesenSCG-928-M11]
MGIIIRQSIKGTLFTYIGAIIGFFTTFYIIPKYIGEELYGLTRVIFEAGFLFAMIFQLGAPSSIIRFFSHFKSKEKGHNGFFFYMICLISIGFFIFIPTFFLLKQPIINYFSQQSPLFVDYLYWLIPLTFFLIYWMSFEVYSNVLMRIAIPKFIREILIRVLFLFIYLAYAGGYIGLTEFITAYVGVYGVAMLITLIYILRTGSVTLKHDWKFITPPLRKEFLSYSSIIITGTLGGSLLSRVDLFMISSEIGLASAGIYAIAFNIVSVMEMPSRSITSISTPIAADSLKRGDFDQVNELYKKVSIHQLLTGSIVFLLIWININNIYAIIPNGDVYGTAKWVVLFMGIAKLMEITISFGGVMISFSKFYHWSLYFTFFITALNIFLNWILIPRFGISGAAIATTCSCLISYSLQQWLVLFKIKANPYSKATLKIIILIGCVLGINEVLIIFANPWLDILFRTSIICIVMFAYIYFAKISEEANGLINNFVFKLRKWKK